MRKPLKRKIVLAEIPDGRRCYTPEQCAEMLGVAMSTLWLILKSGTLKSFKAGRSRRITADAFHTYQDRGAS
ncbi:MULTISPECIES: helix-turn-helix domain-containing protein [Bradyrhizobium]|uniref:helix-turn-helix domain-containing protein n=1 Tax=Bradyrhizobium TaxID=374 RepID=UPI00155E45AE|nr:DNA-binding protein [Bradyrhizobium sp. WBAH30]MDD1541888.1 DNA-binding protein [Bradyrhizobium sp. WBAH41]MDD1555246.1 DNA-binding protein [Bradyrhizobium sp. WBAH23]MDD1564077.1 DNA-binding protein [Bradyrhizobium sp. WBAH33]MDD1587671.1 DNA-binding protein [Bradyrhizobium sp. WBAH42]NRB87357.1 DNA-binding protein [Bradyrhizobium sp. WBAH10]QCJ88942.1 DNA-binding protein [Bradyrhizobium yuanmingense]